MCMPSLSRVDADENDIGKDLTTATLEISAALLALNGMDYDGNEKAKKSRENIIAILNRLELV